ncbi:folylpolyglutamate synthase/dihydrofolate synthase [Prevotella dentalis DSM 3688]|uniref:Dihydrofolate synthase/folylpolyglutamate synthase n=1 Tax=Prevotella dentalis (strain ATCC 49559 / DSM 3688 / JCM 13448 / NCTC 12043 / ES 2772) TaxID=908937 RepID=F9D4X9_PREDD|nr:folylpolyglutamate synthase/dihydrofolate synthase family protein [Prevotella dentalis]AGB29026.1 folylpolyglutamate synthase/dihydrofolate synthase [Prevotella dentalis DSM 3688]EGQ13400.1 tetrahydrofolate synthase [Prevotella dentalis DSM 3688]
MNYPETVAYLFSSTLVFEHVGATAYKEGLGNTLALDSHFGHPHHAYPTIHVAGTNGKGSCSHALAAILQQAGYRVGLYTSPHLVDFRERIRVNGEPISEERVVTFVERERGFFEPLHPSFFELTTALAFLWFKEQKVDVAVIEVGLGGRLDCTNVITPLLSVITNISLDHTQFLGDTLAKIAGEKAGIIKHGVPVVVGEAVAETRPVFERAAAGRQAPVVFAQNNPEVTASTAVATGGRDYQTRSYGPLHGELGGDCQTLNTNTVLTAVSVLRRLEDRTGLHVSAADVRRALPRMASLTGLMGRWQQLHEAPRVVCDTGHNVGGWQLLAPQIAAQPCRQLRIVFGMVDDKDIDAVMRLLPRNAVYYWTQAANHRAIPAPRVQALGSAHGLRGRQYPTVAAALRAAMADAAPDDFVFIGGSSYVVADLLTLNYF